MGCGKQEAPPPPQAQEALQWVEVEERAGGLPAWKLRARSVLRRGETLWVYPVELAFLDPHQDTLSYLTADSGWALENGKMTALGNVRVVTREDTVDTQELTYDPHDRVIRSRVPSRIVQKGRIVRSSKGFVTDPGLNHIQFLGPVEIQGR